MPHTEVLLSGENITKIFGDFKAKSKIATKFVNTSRNLFVASFDNKIGLWEKKSVPNEIDKSYKFTPEIIKPSVVWNTAVNSGLFFYGDGSSQEGITFSSGPDFIFGSLKNDFYSNSKYDNKKLKKKTKYHIGKFAVIR